MKKGKIINYDEFKGKTLLITGGTGTFGRALLNKMLQTEVAKIIIFSRDEKKQYDMQRMINDERVRYFIGDTRDYSAISEAMKDVNYVFHAAALKQVPSCEFHPLEAIKTNVLGTENVLNSAIKNGIQKIVCLSTDKATYPTTAMGMSKALMEKLFISKARKVDPKKTLICGTRFGNILCSRGSVIPLFINQMKNGMPMTITEPNMTRFVNDINDAINLVLFAFNNAGPGDIMVEKAPACTIGDLAQAVKEIFNSDCDTKIIGLRHAEKMHEPLVTKEEFINAIEYEDYYCIKADMRDLNYEKHYEASKEGKRALVGTDEYNSNNTKRLTIPEIKEKLLSIEFIQHELEEWNNGK